MVNVSQSWCQRRNNSGHASSSAAKCLHLLLLLAVLVTAEGATPVSAGATSSQAQAAVVASSDNQLDGSATAAAQVARQRASGPDTGSAAVQHGVEATASTANGAHSVYSALCVVARDENRYIEEWVQYHRCLGVGKIYLYDNNSRKPLADEIQSYVSDGFVQIIPFQSQHVRWEKDMFADNLTKFSATVQGNAYMDCLQRFSERHTFIGFLDVDEFIVFHDPTMRHLADLLRRYEGYAGVSFYWLMFGSGGHKQPPAGWVTRSYLKCLPRQRGQNTQFKTFVNTAYRPTMYSPHRAMFDVQGPTSFLVDENKNRIQPGRNKNSTHNVAAIYHYATKSQQEFDVKRMRGGGAGVTRPRYFLKSLDKACTETCYGAALLYARLCGNSDQATAHASGVS